MKLLASLATIANLLKRLLDKHEQYDQQRKQLQREERRASVADNPSQAFADLFGEFDVGGVRQPDPSKISADVRPNAPAAAVDKNR